MLHFSFRVNGQSPKVETFVGALRLVREVGVQGVIAVSLAFLQTRVAAHWWFGAKEAFSSVEDALVGLEVTFSVRKPPFERAVF